MDGSEGQWLGVSAWPALGGFRPASPGPTVWELTPCHLALSLTKSESASPTYSAGRARMDGQGGDAAGDTESGLCSQLWGRRAEAVGMPGRGGGDSGFPPSLRTRGRHRPAAEPPRCCPSALTVPEAPIARFPAGLPAFWPTVSLRLQFPLSSAGTEDAGTWVGAQGSFGGTVASAGQGGGYGQAL